MKHEGTSPPAPSPRGEREVRYRPVGVNLIEGTRKQVMAFLDELSGGTDGTDGMSEVQMSWRTNWRRVRDAQRGRD